jgi:hypothetical protein
VEVEDEEQASSLEHDNLVALMLQADVCLRGAEPLVLLVEVLHGGIKLVQHFVTQEVVVDEVELPPGVVERVVVSSTGEVEPFGVTELVSCRALIASFGPGW